MKRFLRRTFLPIAVFCLTVAFGITFLPMSETASTEASTSTPRLQPYETIKKIRLIDDKTGFAITNNRLLRTEDTGRTWQNITPVNNTTIIYDAQFLDEANGFAVFSTGEGSGFATKIQLAITNDGGKSWTNHAVNVSQEALTEFGGIAYIDFVDSQKGWLMLKETTSSNFSRGVLLSTKDGGTNWQTLPAPPIGDEINFVSVNAGWLVGGAGQDKLYFTRDGGRTWHERKVIANSDSQVIYDLPTFINEREGVLPVTINASLDSRYKIQDSNNRQSAIGNRQSNDSRFQIQNSKDQQTNSNGQRTTDNGQIVFYKTNNGGATWWLAEKITSNDEVNVGVAFPTSVANDGSMLAASSRKSLTKGNRSENFLENLSSEEVITQLSFDDESTGFVLTTAGRCASFKKDCVQETRLFATTDGGESLSNVTPTLLPSPENQIESLLAAPPGGATHISNKLGFDKCTAAPMSQMTTWWNASPFYDVNIYSSGSNRGCTQAQLTAQWVDQAVTQGWGLIPTHVGLQSPCSSCTTCAKHSTDNATAQQQGRAEADTAHAAAVNLGMAAGTIIYFDMERYTVPNPDTNNCRGSTRAFLNGWTERMRELGNLSGVYGSPCNAREDWTPTVIANSPDVVWMARWWLPPRIFFFGTDCPIEPNWINNQRIHQYQGGHDETWGGVTFNIDRDMSNAPVVGTANNNKQVFHLPPADFDGDGKTDVSIWRPNEGAWYVLQSSNGSFFGAPFGISTDKLMPGDYDGDGWVDFGVYRSSEGNWYQYLRRSISTGFNQFRVFTFGIAEDIPVTDDFDGDARSDYAVFRPSNGTWYVYRQSDRTISIAQFGSTGDVPVAGDYDGDGKADFAVWRPSTGVWYILNSSDGSVRAVSFGFATDKPTEGDFDGDGKTDIAVYRPSEGNWYMMRSTLGFGVVPFGIAEDIPATGDYDGDKKYDQAVFRPSTGIWYVNRSQQGFYAVQFGQLDDKPIPTAYTGAGQ
jgi:photosystem II stability/assembly factor-like uncharacterized protein